jgi:hypothetical protein
MPVELYFEDLAEEMRLPNFRRTHPIREGRST